VRPLAITLYYVSMESPDPDHLFGPKGGKITVDGLPEGPHLGRKCSEDAFRLIQED